MKSKPLWRAIIKAMDRINDRIAAWIGPPVLVVVFAYASIQASRINWALDVVVSSGFGVLAAGLLFGWKRKLYVGHYPTGHLIALWLSTAALAIIVFAAISSMLITYQPDAFTYVAAPLRFEFMQFYFYHLIDSLPALKIWDTFSFPVPSVHQRSLLAGSLLLVFRTVVLATLLGALKDWIRVKNQNDAEPKGRMPGAA